MLDNNYYTLYTIEKGDNLYNIAKKYNINVVLLSAINGIKEDEYIYEGQEILIPKGNYKYYITVEGDTLDIVKDKFETDMDTIINTNNIYLLPGQLIVTKKS